MCCDGFCLLGCCIMGRGLNCQVYIFFFKQKTAYEMRISDWSSDVCSSDLRCPLNVRPCVEALAMRVEHVVHDVRDEVVRMRDIAPHRVAILEHVPLADGEGRRA